jgi:hypothetical protein
MYNATDAATWLWAPQRFATRLSVLRRYSIQRNDLFVNLLSHRGAPKRTALHCVAPRFLAVRRAATYRNSTQRFVCYFSRLNSQPLGAPRRGTPHRTSLQRNDLFVNLSSLQAAALLDFPQRYASLLNDLFISFRASTRSDLARRVAAPRIAPQLNDLFVTPRLVASPRIAAPRLFTQRNDLFVTPRGNVAYSIAALFYSTQRFVCYSASPRIAPKHITLLRADHQRNATN